MTSKRLFSVALALLAVPTLSDPGRDCILNLLNARAGDSPRRYEEAAREVAAEAENGKPLHQFILAIVSSEPDAPQSAKLSDEMRARYLESNRQRIRVLAIQKDNPLAWYLLSLDGNDTSLLKRAAEGDNVQALNELGTCGLKKALSGRRLDERAMVAMRECFGYFNRATAKSDPNAFYNIGVCYLNGWGCKKDGQLAVDSLRRAAELEQPKAINLLGELSRDGVVVDKDSDAATKYFAQSASLGHSRGQYNYAKALASGDGVERNERRALTMMKSAAEQGLVEAMDAYAKMLYDGTGADFSSTNGLEGAELSAAVAALGDAEAGRRHEAVSWWYHCAKTLEYPASMDNLATCFAEGGGVDKSERAAVAWYRRAADKGYVPAMLHLAECCEEGVGGLKKSHYNANWWKTCARAAEGDRNASIWLGSHSLQ